MSGAQFRPIDKEYWKKWEARQASVTHPAKVKPKRKKVKKAQK
jgi:hypothetical protein